jgi:hypothetical protein
VVSIQNFSARPCPWCLVCKSNIRLLGTEEDQYTQEMEACVDDDARRQKVETAHDKIYNWGYVVNSALYVEPLLKDHLLVPTDISFLFGHVIKVLLTSLSECILKARSVWL